MFRIPHVQISMPDRQLTILDLEDGLFPLTCGGLPTKLSLSLHLFIPHLFNMHGSRQTLIFEPRPRQARYPSFALAFTCLLPGTAI